SRAPISPGSSRSSRPSSTPTASSKSSINLKCLCNQMETEGKWRVADLRAVREQAVALGAEPGGVREERNLLFDWPLKPFVNQDCTLRLRTLGDGTGYLTFKGPRDTTAALKVRPEFETRLDSPDAMQAILEAIGFRVALEYAKTREIWHLPSVE